MKQPLADQSGTGWTALPFWMRNPPIWVGRKRSKRPENEAEAVYCPLSRSRDYKYHPVGRCHVRARPKQRRA